MIEEVSEFTTGHVYSALTGWHTLTTKKTNIKLCINDPLCGEAANQVFTTQMVSNAESPLT